jgi:hypothetical protein
MACLVAFERKFCRDASPVRKSRGRLNDTAANMREEHGVLKKDLPVISDAGIYNVAPK